MPAMTIMPTDIVTRSSMSVKPPLVVAQAAHVVAKGQEPPLTSGRVRMFVVVALGAL